MKSTLIALENQKINGDILNLLISTLKCEISVVFATPETLISVVKKSVRRSETVFICNEFLKNLENSKICFDAFEEENYITDENGKITGLYTSFKGTPIAVLPDDFETAQKYINSNFQKSSSGKNFEYNAIGSVYVSNENAKYIEQTLAEFSSIENPVVTVKQLSLYTEISVTAFSNTRADADLLLNNTKNQIKLLLGDDVFSDTNNKIEQKVVNLLIERGLKIATAESCTGGLMSKLITAVPNSSSIFEIGITSYSNRIKHYALSVNNETLKNYGAVSQQTAAEMALGVKNLSGADIGVAITGVAGPSSSEGKPVGTVYVALSNGTHFWVRRLNLSPLLSREEVRIAACFTAFDLVRRYIECLPKILPEYSIDTENINCLFKQPHYINSSLLFMRDSLSDYLTEEQTEKTQAETALPVFENNLSHTSPLQKLQKKVIKKHGVKFRLKLPKINLSFKGCIYRLSTANHIKGFMFDALTKIVSLILSSAILIITITSFNTLAKDYSEKILIKEIQTYWTDSDIKNIDGNYYDFAELNKINRDISGWLTISGTEINNPVCVYRENNYYKSNNYLGKSSQYGTLYFAQNTDFEEPSINTVIYGNNMQNGTMFSDLINYKNKQFAAKAQKIKLTTKKKATEYEVFAVLTLTDNPSYEKADDYFDYTRTEFEDESDFNMWISQIKHRSLYDCDLSVKYSDNIITLVTDSFEFPSAKTVVFARAIEKDTQTGKYPLTVNSEPKLPLIWYQINNLESPYQQSSNSIKKSN